jgi:amino acid transporter
MSDQSLKKVLNRKEVIALAFGAMIGWGWVIQSGTWIMGAGSLGAIIAFLIGGLLVCFVGLTYAELISAMPQVGGEHVYTFRAMGGLVSFITTWAIVLGYVSVVAFEAVALPTAVEYLFPNYSQIHLWTIAGWDVKLTWVLVGIIASVFVTWINYVGIKISSIFQIIFTILVAFGGLFLVFGSVIGGSAENMKPLFAGGGMGGMLAVLIMTPFMFVGFDVIPQAAEEINLKRSTIGRLLIFSVILAVLFYASVIWGVGRALTAEQMAKSNLVTADAMAAAYHSHVMGILLVFGGIGGIITSWIGFYIGGSRALYALARAKMLPAFLGALHPKYKTPHNAILLIGLLSTAAPLFGRQMLVWLVDAGGLGIVVAWGLVALSFLILRYKEPQMERPFYTPAGKLVGWIAVLLSIGIAYLYLPGSPAALVWPYEWGIVLVWAVLGAVFYAWSQKVYGKESSIRYMQEELSRITESATV